MNACITTHKLDFEVAPWHHNDAFKKFRVGTCEGLYICTPDLIGIVAVENTHSGNGHLNDVFEWFEFSCIQNKIPLMVLEIMNERFGKHLIEKRGFTPIEGTSDLIKTFE